MANLKHEVAVSQVCYKNFTLNISFVKNKNFTVQKTSKRRRLISHKSNIFNNLKNTSPYFIGKQNKKTIFKV
jgi:hypothetical protein